MKFFKNRFVAWGIAIVAVLLSTGHLFISNASEPEIDIDEAELIAYDEYVQPEEYEEPEEYEPEDDEPEEEEPEEIPPHTGFGITITDIIELTSSHMARGDGWYPTIKQFEMADGTIVETALLAGIGDIRLLTYRNPQHDSPSTIIFRVASSFRGTLMQNIFPPVRTLAANTLAPELLPHVAHGNATFGDWRLYILCLDNTSDFNFGQLPHTLGDFVENDFFMSEERGNDFVSLYRRGDFLGMEAMLHDYIDEVGSDIEDGDTVFWLLEHLEPMLDVLDQVEIHYDSFDDVATIFYRGLTDISFQNSFVPHTSTRNAAMYAFIGFHNNEWINATRARMQFENGVTILFTMNEDGRTTISGSEIREGRSRRLRDGDVDSLLNSNPVAIRFQGQGSAGAILDRDLSHAEQNAFRVVYRFKDTNFFPNLRRIMQTEF